jgi:DNA topoisomerase I
MLTKITRAARKTIRSRTRQKPVLPENVKDPMEVAKAAGLRYTADTRPGITRGKDGDTFRYFDASGALITDTDVIVRIKSLAIPPAWTDVWICPQENGHLQATGRDARGRKQYRYHPRWREARDENKYGKMIAFGCALPAIRKRVESDLAKPGLSREKVLATVVKLLETTLIRVGNEEYARTNDSFGLTTMEDQHAEVRGAKVRFNFKGKSGKFHEINLHDRRLARIVRRCQDLPGQQLFQYLDQDGNANDITSADVNAYLREITGEDFTAKDFRTWAGTVLAAIALREYEAFTSKKDATRNLREAVERVAERLGNTPSICRKCYVHPVVFESYLDGTLVSLLQQKIQKARVAADEIDADEEAVMNLLETRLAESQQGRKAA